MGTTTCDLLVVQTIPISFTAGHGNLAEKNDMYPNVNSAPFLLPSIASHVALALLS